MCKYLIYMYGHCYCYVHKLGLNCTHRNVHIFIRRNVSELSHTSCSVDFVAELGIQHKLSDSQACNLIIGLYSRRGMRNISKVKEAAQSHQLSEDKGDPPQTPF